MYAWADYPSVKQWYILLKAWLTLPYSVSVIFACLRLTTGHKKRALWVTKGVKLEGRACLDLRPIVTALVTDL